MEEGADGATGRVYCTYLHNVTNTACRAARCSLATLYGSRGAVTHPARRPCPPPPGSQPVGSGAGWQAGPASMSRPPRAPIPARAAPRAANCAWRHARHAMPLGQGGAPAAAFLVLGAGLFDFSGCGPPPTGTAPTAGWVPPEPPAPLLPHEQRWPPLFVGQSAWPWPGGHRTARLAGWQSRWSSPPGVRRPPLPTRLCIL